MSVTLRSHNNRKIVFILLAVAIILRIGMSVVTEHHSIFPGYYYTDARIYEKNAWEIASEWKNLKPSYIKGPFHYHNYEKMLAPVYTIFGRHEIILKFYNVVISMLAILLLFLITRDLFGTNAGTVMLAIVALWPSHIFWSSQILREAFVWLGAYMVIFGSIKIYESYSIKHILLLSIGLFIVGLLRVHDLLPLLLFLPPLLFLILYICTMIKGDRDKVVKGFSVFIPIICIVALVFIYIAYKPLYSLGTVEILNLDKKRPIFSPDEEIKIQWESDVEYAKSRIFLKEIGSVERQVIAEVPGHRNSFTIPPIQKDFEQSPLKILIEGYDTDDKKLARGASGPFFVTYLEAKKIGVDILNLDKERPIFSPDEEIKIQWGSDVRYAKSRIFLKEIGSGELRLIAKVPGHRNSFTIPPIQKDFEQSPLKILIEGYDTDDKKLARRASRPFFVTRLNAVNMNELKDKLKTKQIGEELNDKGFPERLSEKRKDIMNELLKERPPGTLLFPDYEFHSYLDIIKFIPQSAFYVLFMPLPGLYPLDTLGRFLAAIENLFLLILAIFTLLGIFRVKKDLRHYLILLSFLLFITIHSLVEPDLGSAMRHKATYLPLMFMFSSSFFARYLTRETGQKTQER